MATILLLLDAFRYDYLSEDTTPFLWQCAQTGEYYAKVEPSLGYCERTEILTGLNSQQSGFFSAIGFNPQNSPYYRQSWLYPLQLAEESILWFLSFLPKPFSGKVHKWLRYFVSRYFRRNGINMSPYLIPLTWLPYFSLTEDLVDHREVTAFAKPSILSLLGEARRTYFYDTFTALGFQSPYHADNERLDAVVNDVQESPKDLYLVYIASPDAYGHKYGPDSAELRNNLRHLDDDIENFVNKLEGISPGNRYLFLGDHGMLKVTEKVDLGKEISQILDSTALRKESDVIYFLDSTMVRIWAMNEHAKVVLQEALPASQVFNEYGLWLDDATAKSLSIPWPDRQYGDFLWLANPGVLVFPDFFRSFIPAKGMHGYDNKISESCGMCIYWGEGVSARKYPNMPLTGVFSLLTKSLEL